MLSVPLPFVVAILLLVLLAEVVRRDDGLRAGGAPGNLPFLALILVSTLQSVLSVLRWGYGIQGVMYLMPVIAALVPPLAYAGVSRLVGASRLSPLRRVMLHSAPAGLIVLLTVLWRDALDIAIAGIFVFYAGAILLLMRPGADALRRLPFENATPAFRSIIFAALALLFSAALDIYVFFDFLQGRGGHALVAITLGNLGVSGGCTRLPMPPASLGSRPRSSAPLLRMPGSSTERTPGRLMSGASSVRVRAFWTASIPAAPLRNSARCCRSKPICLRT